MTRAPPAVHVLTGFLGAGKTTLLGQWLREPDLRDTAVLVNEFGEIGLDHHFLEAVEGEVVLLANGCICCSIRGDLAGALNNLLQAQAKGRVPPFRRVVIETTGLADPAPICATVLLEPRLRQAFALGNIICCVDALLGAEQLERQAVAVRQVAAADRIILTKTDHAAAPDGGPLRSRLQAMNPSARHYESGTAGLRASEILHEGGFDPENRAAEVRRWASQIPAKPFAFGQAPASPVSELAAAVVLRAERALPWDRFVLWLTMLLHAHGAQILRTKAILTIEGAATPVALHAVQHIVHPPLHLPEWPKDETGSQIVMIVQGLDPEALRASFAAFLGSI